MKNKYKWRNVKKEMHQIVFVTEWYDVGFHWNILTTLDERHYDKGRVRDNKDSRIYLILHTGWTKTFSGWTVKAREPWKYFLFGVPNHVIRDTEFPPKWSEADAFQ